MPMNRYIEPEELPKAAENFIRGAGPHGKISAKRVRRLLKRALYTLKHYNGTVGTASEWILDNRYLIENAALTALRELKSCRRLTADGALPLMYVASRTLLELSGGKCDAGRAEVFFDAAAEQTPLTAADLNSAVPMLRAAAVRLIAELASEADAPEIGALVTSLREINEPGFNRCFIRIDRAGKILAEDPSGVYPKMDEETQSMYRRKVAHIAERRAISDEAAASAALADAVSRNIHIGEVLFDERKRRRSADKRGRMYITAVILLTFTLSLFAAYGLKSALAGVLLLLPVSEAVKNILDLIIMRVIRPERLPRMDFSETGIPEDGRTLAAVSVLLTDENSAADSMKSLEEYRLASRDAGENIGFALLADFPESSTQTKPEDKKVLTAAVRELEKLNRRYGGGFAILVRSRTWSADGRCYMGRERKRGAIEELALLLKGKESSLTLYGDRHTVEKIKYMLVLDSDTRVTPGSARRLVEAAMHPLSKPVLSDDGRRVLSGFGIIAPRISVSLEAAGRSIFTSLMAGHGGCDAYGGVCSDLYQDMLGSATFCGKGLIDVDCYNSVLSGRFPKERILSHDLLEGAYMGCAYAGDIELTDSFPKSAASFFKRQHRWVRGDWQTAAWLGIRVPVDGGYEENPLTDGNKWKIFDNLRRSMVPVAAFASIIAGLGSSRRDIWITSLIALLAYFSGALLSAALDAARSTTAVGHLRPENRRALPERLASVLLRFSLLPMEAWTNVSAAVTAVYRICVSKRGLLDWVTAAQTEAANNGAGDMFSLWPCIVFGAAAAVTSYDVSGYVAAVLWISSPFVLKYMTKPRRGTKPLSTADKVYLMEACRDAYAYFTDTGAEDNYLPPDNRQIRPALGAAHRTSPTNIGMALMSHLAALDMGLATCKEAAGHIRRILDTVEKLKLWNGHLYNWYDTRTLAVIGGGFVSTVDSGNFTASLMTVAVGMEEVGENILARRALTMAMKADFRPLYDRRTRLFYTGWDTSADRPAGSRYDLLESEARLTSYVAVAMGQVPREHWQSLGRVLVSGHGLSGLASWTGTMFEYFMPHIWLPAPRGSMLSDALRFCVSEQRRAGEIWGESESGYFAVDNSLAYSYKAHGIASLALRRGMEQDAVISPYSSFLALPTAGKKAVENLRKLQKMGLYGKYGFYEAVDFTPSRTEGKGPKTVAAFMAHHIGMSIAAVDNAVMDSKMTRRFMSIPQMAAMRTLLEEKIPEGAVLLSRRPAEQPEIRERTPKPSWSLSSRDIDPLAPQCVILSNGAYSLLITDTGLSRSKCGETEITRFNPGADGGYGIAAAVRMAGEKLPITPAPWFDPNTKYGFDANLGSAGISARKGGLAAAMICEVPEYETGELRRFPIISRTDGRAELVLMLRPVLCFSRDYEAHPAFNRLMLDYEIRNGVISVRRRGGGGRHEKWMAVAINAPAVFSADWEENIGRSAMPAKAIRQSGDKGPMPAGGLVISVALDLKAGIRNEILFAMAVADHREDAESAAKNILSGSAGETGSFAASRVSRFGLDDASVSEAMELISKLEFNMPAKKVQEQGRAAAQLNREDLWKAGISGDIPIFAKEAGIDAQASFSRPASIHAFLTAMGERYDLALITDDGGEYLCPEGTAARGVLRKLDLLHTLGHNGGVHIVDRASGCAEAVLNASVNREIQRIPGRKIDGESLEDNQFRVYPVFKYSENSEYCAEFNGVLPPRSYSHITAGENFGFIATESGSGNMWCRNANLGRITPWSNERFAADGPERLSIILNGKKTSLFASDDGYVCLYTCGIGYASWEKTIGSVKTNVTAFALWDEPVRILRISLEGADDAEIEYCAKLAAGDRNKSLSPIKPEVRDGLFVFPAPVGSDGVTFAFSGSLTDWTCSFKQYLQGKFDRDDAACPDICCAVKLIAEKEMIIVTAGAGEKTAEAYTDPVEAERLYKATLERWCGLTSNKLRLETGIGKLDRYMSGWALYQVIASRMLARAGFDQCGGAFGFRDQLQDVRALMYTTPELARRHILLAASRQYTEGDVQHWWHPGTGGGRGVRTKCSDDLLWLPFVLSEYTEVTGDESICAECVPWLISSPLAENEPERYEQAGVSGDMSSVMEHALKALDTAASRGTDAHGLLKIGGGDWNDGMAVSPDSGSIWLTEFASLAACKTAELCCRLKRETDAERIHGYAETWRRAVEGWLTGFGYPRAVLPDGSVIGARQSPECSVDSISQSWAVLCGIRGDSTKAAVKYAADVLNIGGIPALFMPPFDGVMPDPGYIARYAPGFRENGGQYTHGAVWLAAALLASGMNEDGAELLISLLPEDKTPSIYRGEPYVLPGDVSTNRYTQGMAGWTWYTGSAAWFFTETVKRLLGINVRGRRLFVNEEGIALKNGYKADFMGHRIEAEPKDGGGFQVCVDKMPLPEDGMPL